MDRPGHAKRRVTIVDARSGSRPRGHSHAVRNTGHAQRASARMRRRMAPDRRRTKRDDAPDDTATREAEGGGRGASTAARPCSNPARPRSNRSGRAQPTVKGVAPPDRTAMGRKEGRRLGECLRREKAPTLVPQSAVPHEVRMSTPTPPPAPQPAFHSTRPLITASAVHLFYLFRGYWPTLRAGNG